MAALSWRRSADARRSLRLELAPPCSAPAAAVRGGPKFRAFRPVPAVPCSPSAPAALRSRVQTLPSPHAPPCGGLGRRGPCGPATSGGLIPSPWPSLVGPAQAGPSGSLPSLGPTQLPSLGFSQDAGSPSQPRPTSPSPPPHLSLAPSPASLSPPTASCAPSLAPICQPLMARDAGDGELRPKRRAPGRDVAPRPSPDGSRREAELREALVRGKEAAPSEGSDWRTAHPRERSPSSWRGRGRDRDRPSPRRSRSPPRSGRSEASPPRRYDPPRRQAQFPPARPNNGNNHNGRGAFAKKKKKRGAQSQLGGPASSVTHPPVPAVPPPAVSAATCFNCGVTGHCQVDCTQPLACFRCSSTDHPAVLCPDL
nr:vegetative cell wall protein gp1-like [Aegilops tauschii subsp. strangulata]